MAPHDAAGWLTEVGVSLPADHRVGEAETAEPFRPWQLAVARAAALGAAAASLLSGLGGLIGPDRRWPWMLLSGATVLAALWVARGLARRRRAAWLGLLALGVYGLALVLWRLPLIARAARAAGAPGVEGARVAGMLAFGAVWLAIILAVLACLVSRRWRAVLR